MENIDKDQLILSLEARYPQVYRQQGIRYFVKMEDPKVNRVADLQEIDLSILHYFYPNMKESFGISPESPFVKNRKKAQVSFHHTDYAGAIAGPYKKKIFNYRLAIKAYHKKNPGIFWARNERKFFSFRERRPWNMIVDYSLMGRRFEFRYNPRRHLFEFEAKYKGYLNGISYYTKQTNRHQLMMFHVPEQLPKVPELKRAAIEMKRSYFKIFDSYEKLALLDFWKWLDPYTRSKSFFAQYIQEKDLDRIDLLCLYGNTVVLLNLGLLDRWVTGKESLGEDEEDNESPEDLIEGEELNITQSTARRFQKRFLRFLAKIVEKDKLANSFIPHPLEIDEKETKDIQVIYDTNTEETLKDDDFQDPEVLEDKGDDTVLIPPDIVEEKQSESTQARTEAEIKSVISVNQQPHAGGTPSEAQTIVKANLSDLNTATSALSPTHPDPIQQPAVIKENYTPVEVNQLVGIQTQIPEKELITKPVSSLVDVGVKKQVAQYTEELGLTKKQNDFWEKAAETYKTLKSPVKGKTLGEFINEKRDITLNQEDAEIPDIPMVTDKSLLKSTIMNMQRDYIKKDLKRDIARNIVAMQKTGVLVSNYEVEDTSNLASDTETHVIQFTPVGGSPSTVRLKLPKVHEDGTIRQGGVRTYLRSQRRDRVIRKIDSDRVALTTYYGKLFLNRSDKKKYNLDNWVLSQVDRLISEGTYTDIQYGAVRSDIKDLPRIIQALMSRYRGFHHKKLFYTIDFTKITQDKNGILSFGKHVQYNPKDDTWLVKNKPTDINEVFSMDLLEAPDEYAEVKILGVLMPVGFILARELGFARLVEMLRLPVEKYEAGKQIERNSKQLIIRFADEKWVFDKSIMSTRDKLIIAGMNYYARYLKQYSALDFDTKEVYGAILHEDGVAVRYERELDLIQDLFIDDSSREMLEYMKEPTEMVPLYIRAVELLSTSHYVDEINMDDMVIKGYERIAGAVYSTFVNHMRLFKSKPITTKRRFDMPPNDVMIMLSKDPSMEIIDDINPIQNVKEKENVTFTGEGGRSKRSMVKRTRTYSDSDMGVISEASVDSSDIGITTFLSANPRFDTKLGTTTKHQTGKELDASQLFSTPVLLSPFSIHDDQKRQLFVNTQSSHRIPIRGAMPPCVRTGYENVLAHRVDEKFAYVAKGDGVIKEKGPKYVLISYNQDDLGEEMVEIGVTIASSKGSYFRHDIKCDRDVGYKFKKGEVLVFNQAFFQRDVLSPTQVILCDKTYARVMLVESNDTFEDSSAVSMDFAKQLKSSVVKERVIVVNATDNLRNMVKLNDEVDIDDSLVLIEDQAFSDAGYFSGSSLDILKRLSQISPKAKYKGKVIKIDCFYYCDEDDLSPSIKEVVNQIMKYRFSGTKMKLSDKRHMTGQIDEPLKLKSQEVLEGQVGIRIYIETDLGFSSGDKLVVK